MCDHLEPANAVICMCAERPRLIFSGLKCCFWVACWCNYIPWDWWYNALIIQYNSVLNGTDALPLQKNVIVNIVSLLGGLLLLFCTYCKSFMLFLFNKLSFLYWTGWYFMVSQYPNILLWMWFDWGNSSYFALLFTFFAWKSTNLKMLKLKVSQSIVNSL